MTDTQKLPPEIQELVDLPEDKIPGRLFASVMVIRRIQKRLADYAGGVPKLEAKIKADPKSVKVEGLKRRIAEYQSGLEGLPPKLASAVHDLKTRLAAK